MGEVGSAFFEVVDIIDEVCFGVDGFYEIVLLSMHIDNVVGQDLIMTLLIVI